MNHSATIAFLRLWMITREDRIFTDDPRAGKGPISPRFLMGATERHAQAFVRLDIQLTRDTTHLSHPPKA